VSIAYAAVRLGQQIFGNLSDKTALLIGAGETIELTARHLHEAGLNRMIIANRTLERSQNLAGEFSGYAISLEDIRNHLDEADIIITATSSTTPIINKEMIERAIIQRKHRPVYIVDIAVPRDVDTRVSELDDVYLYSVDDLQGVIDDNLRNREEAAKQAEEIIDSQVVHFMDWMESLHSVTTIKAIRDQARNMQQQALDTALKRLRQGEDPETVMKEMARSLTNKIIHSPSATLRNVTNLEKDDLTRAARILFDIHTDNSGSDKDN
jgi:glutamyl-tRNA reductase